ncbi:hypothetical protein NDU88_004145 [Pleurodeles waltl]|uniref:Uncharacterized protein n=1 Tax=Pleurodeles waltl TaxID=8319 RepID=A0AAV7QGX2_PLEWA|nr:hypothetical protein NDU88_004145 [Pleurodeles waltl]
MDTFPPSHHPPPPKVRLQLRPSRQLPQRRDVEREDDSAQEGSTEIEMLRASAREGKAGIGNAKCFAFFHVKNIFSIKQKSYDTVS